MLDVSGPSFGYPKRTILYAGPWTDVPRFLNKVQPWKQRAFFAALQNIILYLWFNLGERK